MLRRRFLQNIATLSGGLLIGSFIPAKALSLAGATLKGRVLSGGRGVKGVVVSDGYSVVATDKKGRYEFELHPDAVTVHLSTPSGYAFKNEANVARQYRLLQNSDGNRDVNFDLVPLGQDDNEHSFIVWADSQVANAKDVERMMTQSVPCVKNTVAAAAPGTLLHGITVGDIVWDKLEMFADYDKAVAQMGIPFFQCIGNHDMEFRKGGDETSDDTFTQTYGPTTYSFNRGQVHYVVMDNVRYLGKEREYDGWFQQHHLDWLKKDLSFVPADKLIVLCCHIPVHSGTKNNADLYAILGSRNVHIMSGHTHYLVNSLTENVYEHNHGTVCGAWWTGPICGDGTPSGYGVYTVKGNQLSWRYQSTGKPADYQIKLYAKEGEGGPQVIANIWNYDPEWKTEYFVDGVARGPLKQVEDFDPLAYSTMLGPDLPKPRGFAEPKKTDHLFEATVSSSAKEVKVVATDRFGARYEAVHLLTA